MSERKVLNKYFPPDFDPSKIKRRKGVKDPQQVVRLMAPFSMRCTRCGEYVYKGKKFNARKETVQGEEYYGIKLFRFYIKCPVCSSEITFKTDPKNADYTCEHGAIRNFENWTDADPGKSVGAMPDAAADDDYDSDGNAKEEKKERDAMADLERSQEQSRREMEMMDELADLRQRNARLEMSDRNADPEALLSALHAERQNAEEEAKKRMEEDEDDALVRQYFAKLPSNGAGGKADNGKGKGRAVEDDGSDSGGEGSDADEDDGGGEEALTIKRRPVLNGGNGSAEPSVASILAAKGRIIDAPSISRPPVQGSSGGVGSSGSAPALAQAKRKREGMQKLLGIKKKVKA